MGPVESNNNLEYTRVFDDLAVCEINLLKLVCHRQIKKIGLFSYLRFKFCCVY